MTSRSPGSLPRTTRLRSSRLARDESRARRDSLSSGFPALFEWFRRQRIACRLLQHNRLADTVRKQPVLFGLERASVRKPHAGRTPWGKEAPSSRTTIERPHILPCVRVPQVTGPLARFREETAAFGSVEVAPDTFHLRRRTVLVRDRVPSTRKPGVPFGATRDPPVREPHATVRRLWFRR